jgi:hypothetical protein
MKQVVLNVNGLTGSEQIDKGAVVITKSTDNPSIPGTADELAAFVTAHGNLETAHAASEAARAEAKAKTAARAAALRVWKAKLKLLAVKIEDVTEGEEAAVLSTGFELRSDATPAQALGAPLLVQAATNGTPGMTKLSWEPLEGADWYIVETCADPMTPDGWEQIDTPTKANCTVEGAEPGKVRWYRVAGVNSVGQGPWSDPAARPVM